MNLFTPAEMAVNYSNAGAAKTKLPISKMLLLGILAGMLIAFPSCVTNMATGISKVKHAHEDVVRTANEASARFCAVVVATIGKLGAA